MLIFIHFEFLRGRGREEENILKSEGGVFLGDIFSELGGDPGRYLLLIPSNKIICMMNSRK
jgi:hypothetical protein